MMDKIFQWRLNRLKKRCERYKQKSELLDSYAEYLPDKKEKKVSNIMLFIIVVAIVGYTVAGYILQYKTLMEISPTITTAWFAFWGTEIVALAAIKVRKVGKDSSNTTTQDDSAVG